MAPRLLPSLDHLEIVKTQLKSSWEESQEDESSDELDGDY